MADTKMTKSAGEHWVCSVLSRCGWAAALTRDGLERTDILAVQTHVPGQRQTIEVQVKSTRWMGDRGRWKLGLTSQRPAESRHEWFALVMLDPEIHTKAPRSFIVPRDHVAAAAWIGHKHYLTDRSMPPGTRNSSMDESRVAIETFLGYEDRWDLLGTRTDQVPVMLPEHYRELAVDPRVGLPDEHPWKIELPEW